MFFLYVLGIVVAIVSAKLFRSTVLPGDVSPFVMEMPPYRLPTAMTSLMHMWSRGSMYLRKAGTIILLGAMVVWALASFPYGVEYGSAESFAGMLGHLIEPLVAPLGFDWKVAVALIFGFLAKEVVVGSLGVLYGTGEETLSEALLADPGLSAATALALMVFVCSTCRASRRSASSKKRPGRGSGRALRSPTASSLPGSWRSSSDISPRSSSGVHKQ